MPYATQADLLSLITERELLQLTDDARTGQINASVVASVLADGAATIDSYCRTRYQVPLQASQDAQRINRDLALWNLYSRRPQKMPEGPQARYTAAMKFLTDISTGKASLDQQTGSPSPQIAAGGPVLPKNRDERFNDRNMEGFV